METRKFDLEEEKLVEQKKGLACLI